MYERWRKRSRHDDLHAYLRKVLTNNHTSMWRRRTFTAVAATKSLNPPRGACGSGFARSCTNRSASIRRRSTSCQCRATDCPYQRSADATRPSDNTPGSCVRQGQ
ncbi:hypothetical protein AB0J90_20320 [Micromonospora sp. NPDC049523]|uniref:hypothetical protein n=1 Tax=Micromonospora sp. NPDC049523 TaxID=3155921 RepID=UPI00341B9A8A